MHNDYFCLLYDRRDTMGKIARNALKGYTYQNYVLTLFFAKMDTDRNISKIESEALETKQFDDIYLEEISGSTYRIQAKNYPKATLEDIIVTQHTVSICNNQNAYESADNNVLFVNSNKIPTDTFFMGFPATVKENITIIPMTEEAITIALDDMFQQESRELQIIQKAYEFTCSQKFVITMSDLPKVILLSTDLQERTILLRPIPDNFTPGITYIVGKPGVGKSHYVEELKNKYTDSIIYRFWIGPHDENLIPRLHFDNFLNELGILVFKSPRAFTKEELISKMKLDDCVLIIDGLDHVENYNPKELEKFILFIDSLGNAEVRIVVLSRPMKAEINWDKKELLNWDFEEVRLYLASSYGILDYNIHRRIYQIADGYPIITYFLAEHFKKYGNINFESPISDLNTYYDNLLNNVATKSSLCVCATSNSFFTIEELKILISEPELFECLMEFISSYPYLFEIVQNRVSLIHDSFNTYLRGILPSFPKRRDAVCKAVQSSLLEENVEFMARLSTFNFDDLFLDKLLIKYSDFSVFRRLLHTTLDFNSIASFYTQLQRILEGREGILNIYQYYSFALIFQTATRNDLVGYEGLMYQILLYMHDHGNIEQGLFSSGIMWHLYLACKQRGDLTKKFIVNSMYGEHQFDSLLKTLNDEVSFFNCLDEPFSNIDIVHEMKSPKMDNMQKTDLLRDYLVSIVIHNKENCLFYNEFCKYLNGKIDNYFIASFKAYDLDHFWVGYAFSGAKNKLHELGLFGSNNIYRTKTFMELIMQYAPSGSFSVAPAAQAFLRLANRERRQIDIFSVNYVWTMYAQRKDYSVYTMDDALIVYEEKDLIKESESVDILNKLIDQSEKGIRLLLSSYINKKGPECTKRLISAGKFSRSNEINCDIFDLNPENINCFSLIEIDSRIIDMLRSHYHSKFIEARDITNVLNSNYSHRVLEALAEYGFSVVGSIDSSIKEKLATLEINYIDDSTEKEEPYVPFSGGYIHKEDFEYIKENKLPPDICARYADGWYSCLPFVELFELFPIEKLQPTYLHILHQAMFARVANNEYIGNWYNLIGNVPLFIKVCNIDIDWKCLFNIFMSFLDVSLIYHP